LEALVRRSPLSPTEMLRTSFWTLISLIGLLSFLSEACFVHNQIQLQHREKQNRLMKQKSYWIRERMRGTIVVWRSGGRETGHWSGTPWEIGGYNRSGTTCVLGFVAVALNDDNAPFKIFFFFFFF
jgi:hypothetical protein